MNTVTAAIDDDDDGVDYFYMYQPSLPPSLIIKSMRMHFPFPL